MNYNKTVYQIFDIESNLKEKSGKSYKDFNKDNNKTNIKKHEINDNNDVSIEEIQI